MVIGFNSLNKMLLVQRARYNTACQISSQNWKIRHYVNHFSKISINALELSCTKKVSLKTVQICYEYREIILAAMFGIYTPRMGKLQT